MVMTNMKQQNDESDDAEELFMNSNANSFNFQTVKSLSNDNENELTEEELYGDIKELEVIKLLKRWKLEQYINILIVDKGFEEVEDWKDLSLDDLQRFGFKEGHSKKFMRKLNEHFGAKEVTIEGKLDDNMSGSTNSKGMVTPKITTEREGNI